MFEHRDGSTVRVQPRLGQDGWGGNSTRGGSPFLWVLSFGEAKAKYLAVTSQILLHSFAHAFALSLC
jgi:hypothetical protein